MKQPAGWGEAGAGPAMAAMPAVAAGAASSGATAGGGRRPLHPDGGPWRGNIRVLMAKNFILKKRMYQKLVLGFFPILLFMELVVPPAMLLGLTWVKMEAPLYMKLSGYGCAFVCGPGGCRGRVFFGATAVLPSLA
eukprot:SAG22_NODE_205_length_15308_cov_20.539023_26_plen_136_part_00